MAGIGNRIVRAARLEPALYEEVEADRAATGEALAVVVLSSVAGGLSALGQGGLRGLVMGTLGDVIGWVIMALTILFVGTKLLAGPQTRADLGELLRTMGYASSPGLIRVVGIIPGAGWIANPVALLWVLAATVIAVRQALDFPSTGRAVAVCIVGWVLYFVATMFLFALAGTSLPAA